MKRWIAGLLFGAVLMTLAGCNTVQQDTALQEAPTRVMVDGVGREVVLPEQVERIVPLGNTPRMAVYLGLADKFVGIGECEIADSPIMAYAYPYREAWAELPVVGTDSMGETAYYAEEIILARPDVILCNYTANVADSIQAQTGIPVFAVQEADLFSEGYDEALRLLGEVCGAAERAEAVIRAIDDNIAELESRTKDLTDAGKPTVLGAGATFKGSHSIDGVYTNYPVFEILSAMDVAEDIAGQTGSSGVMVDREQILIWDPEIIFFDAASMELVRADYAEDPDYFEQLQAVKNGALYQWPNSTWHWSNVEIPMVCAYYVGATLYPEAFADVDLEAKAAEIFDFFIGQPDYLSVLEEAGAGYSKVTLGE
ncbi:MAG: ABC transporter substrate-binding protein [Oscillospiraceae bacterium]|nr:ABC transporter substrate-binding protein [Oscillospiraceae bacterium]